MAKTITITYEAQKFTLEFTRNSVKALDKKGFDISKISSTPLTTITELFSGAFIAHHATLKEEYKEQIYSQLKDKSKLLEVLAEMYNETITTLFEDPDAGNASWETN